MKPQASPGECRLCGQNFDKRQITRHLKSCWQERITGAPGKSKAQWFHLVVEGRHDRFSWLHLQASAKSTFGDLDAVLRRVWLECCGHMSEFSFPERRLARGRGLPTDVFSLDLNAFAMAMGMGDEDAGDELMEQSLGSKLAQGIVFSHDYDFGSTTTLALRVAGEFDKPAVKGTIKVLARNAPPDIRCSACQKPATQICSECFYQGNSTLCDACAAEHECGEEMLLPLVNSPRAGVCGYSGPSVEP